MSEEVRTSPHDHYMDILQEKYPSFEAKKTTDAQCFFHSREGVKCIDDLGKIIQEGSWGILFVYYRDTKNSGMTNRIDLILKDREKNVLDITLYFAESQEIDNLKILVKSRNIAIGSTQCELPDLGKNMDFGFVPDFPEISSFVTIAGCMGSVTTLLKGNYVERVADITK